MDDLRPIDDSDANEALEAGEPTDLEPIELEPVADLLPEGAASDPEPFVLDDELGSTYAPVGDLTEPVELEPAHEAESLALPETEALTSGEGEALADVDIDGESEETAVMDALPLALEQPEPKRRRLLRRRGDKTSVAPIHRENDKRAKRLVGLKIGASQLAAARIANNGAPELLEVVREPLEPGLVVSGEIRDTDTLTVAIRRFFELHKLPKKGVRLGLSNNRIGVRVFEIEGVNDTQQLENAIRYRAEEVLPIPLDEAVLDYAILGESTKDDGMTVKRILLVVAYREVVDRFLVACRNAGLEVVGIDLEAFALLRALGAPTDELPGGGALVAVAIGHDRTTIAVSTGRHCEFTRVLDWGGWSLNVAIARELDRAPSEVEGVKRQLSFASETHVEGITPDKVAKTREALQRALAAFTRELVSSLHFYQAQPGALGIGEIVLTGGTAHMPGLSEAVGRLIGVPVRLGDPFERVKVGSKVEDLGQHGSLSVAIGLGIED